MITFHGFLDGAGAGLLSWALFSRLRWKNLAKHAVEIVGQHADWAKEREVQSAKIAKLIGMLKAEQFPTGEYEDWR